MLVGPFAKLVNNLELVTAFARGQPSDFDIVGEGSLKRSSILQRFFRKMQPFSFYSTHSYCESIAALLKEQFKGFAELKKINPLDQTLRRFYPLARRFNQIQISGESSLIKQLALPLLLNAHLPQINPSSFVTCEVSSVPDNLDQSLLPTAVEVGDIYKCECCPSNGEGKKIFATKQAIALFLKATLYRFLSLVRRVIESVGFKSSKLSRFHFFQNRTKRELAALKSTDHYPLSVGIEDRVYALGESSCLLSLKAYAADCESITLNVVKDPCLGNPCSLIYPRIFQGSQWKSSKLSQNPGLMPADIVVLTSGNFPHFDSKTLQSYLPQSPCLVVPQGLGSRVRKIGFKNIAELSWWQTAEIKLRFGKKQMSLKITATPSNYHSCTQVTHQHQFFSCGFVLHGRASEKTTDDTLAKSCMLGDVYLCSDQQLASRAILDRLRDRFLITHIVATSDSNNPRRGNLNRGLVQSLFLHLELLAPSKFQDLGRSLQTAPSLPKRKFFLLQAGDFCMGENDDENLRQQLSWIDQFFKRRKSQSLSSLDREVIGRLLARAKELGIASSEQLANFLQTSFIFLPTDKSSSLIY